MSLYTKTTADFIQEFGYPVEQYNVTTKDGYILSLHRIPRSPKNDPLLKTFQNFDNKVVLLIPGLFSSSADFVLMGPNKSLALFLSDHGYDVWLGNNRGNKYSRMHQNLDPDSNLEYWDFSWHEMGTEDLPTIIDFVLKFTGQSKLDYIGHSQGTCVFFVMASTKPEYNQKIRSMHALAPSIFMSHMKSNALNWANVLMDTVHATENNSREMLRYDGRISVSLRKFCIMSKFSTRMCYEIISDMIGRDEEQLDLIGIIPLIYHNSPAGSSTNQILHFWQNYNTERGPYGEADGQSDDIDSVFKIGSSVAGDTINDSVANKNNNTQNWAEELEEGENNNDQSDVISSRSSIHHSKLENHPNHLIAPLLMTPSTRRLKRKIPLDLT
ncbi:lipase 3-like [Ctenocephalides felis]|uniref:lipase 3-like n=1 Tax=Ctenocephalides felis TaxID=7515 RepID=UPI000E6E538E|nr:lipase 3-like [Ctenocephalides felis]